MIYDVIIIEFDKAPTYERAEVQYPPGMAVNPKRIVKFGITDASSAERIARDEWAKIQTSRP